MAVKKRDTKQKILEESMWLFSISGFDAVSIRAIAEAVGIGNSALYKHYRSKQDILDAIVAYSTEYFTQYGCQRMAEIQGIDEMKKACISMYDFQTKDEWVVMFRRLLMIEQFKNPKMAEIYQAFFIDLPIASQAELFRHLMEQWIMRQGDAEEMSMELYAPFFLYHTVTISEEKRHQLEHHVESFYKSNIIDARKEGEEYARKA